MNRWFWTGLLRKSPMSWPLAWLTMAAWIAAVRWRRVWIQKRGKMNPYFSPYTAPDGSTRSPIVERVPE